MPDLFVEVWVDQNVGKPLDYAVPSEWGGQIDVGMRVEIPLKRGISQGTISAVKHQSRISNLKSIVRILSHHPELTESQWKLAEWIADYYATPFQKVLKCFIPSYVRQEVEEKKRVWVSLLKSKEEVLNTMGSLRQKHPSWAVCLEELLQAPRGLFLSEMQSSKQVVQALAGRQWICLKTLDNPEDILLEEEFFPTTAKSLNEEQKKCLDRLVSALNSNTFSSHLLQGVTGSGKTEVYLQAIQHTLEMGKSAILLVPEIALTSQTIERLRSRFSEKVAILHHRRSQGEKNSAWEDLQSGKARLVCGARSAIFCPIQKLGLIIIDEEHDSSYKQSGEMPCYSARDVAVKRAHIERAVVLLGSATPSIESRYNAQIGKYHHHILSQRAAAASLAQIRIVDMKQAMQVTGRFTHFSSELLDGIQKRVQAGEQTLLFLNRRGTHRMQICGTCRKSPECPHCDLALAYHRDSHCLQCHLCNYQLPPLKRCPFCNQSELFQFKGFGTEHVERSLHAVFPEIRTLRMDRDTTRTKHSHEELFKQFRSHKADVLIGTQMVVKGFHFPAVTLVGVLNHDSALLIPDFRSSEVAFQMLTQVAGRAGRSTLKGEVVIQTFMPDHPLFSLAINQDYEGFYKEVLEERKQFSYPPFCRFIKVVFFSKDPQRASKEAESFYKLVQEAHLPDYESLPVTATGHPKIKDFYYFQFIIKTKNVQNSTKILKDIKDCTGIDCKIDVDTIYTFF